MLREADATAQEELLAQQEQVSIASVDEIRGVGCDVLARVRDKALAEGAEATQKLEEVVGGLRCVVHTFWQEETVWSGGRKQYLDRIHELESVVTTDTEVRAQAQSEPCLDHEQMEMLGDLYRRINVAMEAGSYEKLPRPGVGGTPTAPGHYILAPQPVAEKLEEIAAKARSAMDAKVWQAFSDVVSEILWWPRCTARRSHRSTSFETH